MTVSIGFAPNFSNCRGLCWVSQLMGWVKSDHTKWTHGQLWFVELVSTSFLTRLFNILFLLLSRRFLHHARISWTFFIPKHFTSSCFPLLKAPCSFLNDELYEIKDFFNFFTHNTRKRKLIFMRLNCWVSTLCYRSFNFLPPPPNCRRLM